MRTFTCGSTVLYVYWPAAGDLAPVPLAEAGVGGQEGGGHHQQAHQHPRGHLVALQTKSSVADPGHFGTDPEPRIDAYD
jgi:hypothetical protein